MDDQVRKFTELQKQREEFSTKLISESSRLDTLKGEYSRVISSIKDEMGLEDAESLYKYILHLEQELAAISSNLKETFEKYVD